MSVFWHLTTMMCWQYNIWLYFAGDLKLVIYNCHCFIIASSDSYMVLRSLVASAHRQQRQRRRSDRQVNLFFFGPTQFHNPNAKSIGSAVFAPLTAESPHTLQLAPLFPRLFLSMGGSELRLIYDYLSQYKPTTQRTSPSVQPFLRKWPQSVPILYNGPPLPPQNCRFQWGDVDSHLIRGSLIRSSRQPKRHLDRLSRFATLPSVTDRQTDG